MYKAGLIQHWEALIQNTRQLADNKNGLFIKIDQDIKLCFISFPNWPPGATVCSAFSKAGNHRDVFLSISSSNVPEMFVRGPLLFHLQPPGEQLLETDLQK